MNANGRLRRHPGKVHRASEAPKIEDSLGNRREESGERRRLQPCLHQDFGKERNGRQISANTERQQRWKRQVTGSN